MKFKFAIFVLFYTINLFAQQYILRTVTVSNSDSEYTISIQIKMENPGKSNLGNATLRFSYNVNDLSFAGLPAEGVDYSFNFINTGHYFFSVTRPEVGEISVNIYYKNGVPQIITNKYYNLVTIKFNKKMEFANFKINKCTTEIFSPNKQKPWQIKNFLLGFQSNISSKRM